MIDNRKLVVRKTKDGINHEAVIMNYCGGWYESRRGSGHTETDAIYDLIDKMRTEIYMLERDLDLACYGRWESKTEKEFEERFNDD